MVWHKLEDISRIKKTHYPKGFFWNLVNVITGGSMIWREWQFGIRLINEEGITKDVWAKK